ncbi:MAG: PLDc N-terminal domain-containing protein [Bifidobacteriaceae bacterium]|jgi:hypothetical protein|nr:PLDc N-terminal domain-containing protein [Bifidobacteriaceae bacterium]
MLRILLLYVLPIALALYALIDCVADDDVERTSVPKVVWVLVILLLGYVGPLAWLAVSKIARPHPGRAGPRRRGPLAPDDNPAFLRQLAEEQARRERERRRRERDQGGDGPKPSTSDS